MGRAISKLKHPFRDFNVESRAHKVISQPDKKPAPKHAKEEEHLKKLKQDYHDAFEESLKKDEKLDKHLKDVFVVSHDVPVEQAQQPLNPARPLPQDRSQPEQFLFGHKEPDQIPEGKTTLRNALYFLTQHQNEPSKYTPAQIAKGHNLNEEAVKKILEYYKVFQVYIPTNKTNTKATFAGPSRMKIEVIKEPWKQLPAPEEKNDKDKT